MTKKRLMEKLRDDPEMSSKTVNCIGSLMECFATPEAFFAASKGEILRQWHMKGHDRDLGDRFFRAFDRALAVWKSPDDEVPPPRERKFTKDDLKTVVDAMELLNIPEMDSTQMASILDMRGAGK